MRKINRKKVSEELSVDAYEDKISRLSRSGRDLKKELEDEHGLPTSQDELGTLLKSWFDSLDYGDDERGFDAAMAYYLSEYGADSIFNNALEAAIENMKATGYTQIYEHRMRGNRVARRMNESMSVSDYENKIKNFGSSDELKNILIHEYDLPTEKEELAKLIQNWFNYQDYIDDPRGYDVALAYYYAAYGDDNVFQTAIKDAVQNMQDNGFADVNESKIRNRKNAYKTRKTFEKFRNMKKNKVNYRVNESARRRTFKRLPMFENYLQEQYDSVKLLDGHQYKLTADVVAEDGQVLAKAGDTVTYEDVAGVFRNNYCEFTTDCGVFRTEDGQALQPEILLSQNLLEDPKAKMTEDPEKFMAEVVSECRKAGNKAAKAAAARQKIYESLTEEQKKKYQEKKANLTQDQITKYTKDIDEMEAKAQKLYDDMEAGKITQEEMMQKTDRLTKSALEKYRTITGGEDPAWYEEYMDEPGFGKVNESYEFENTEDYPEIIDKVIDFCSAYGYNLPKDALKSGKLNVCVAIDNGDWVDFQLCDPSNITKTKDDKSIWSGNKDWSKWIVSGSLPGESIYESRRRVNECDYSTILLSENDAKADSILKFCADCGFELTKEQLKDNHVDVEVAVDAEGNYVDFRIYDPNNSVSSGYKYADGWSNWMLDTYEVNEDNEATDAEVKEVTTDDILTPETVEAVLVDADAVKDETVKAVVDAVKDDIKDGEEVSLDDVVDATVDAELPKEEAVAVIDAVADAVVDQKAEDTAVNESKQRSLKKAVKENLHKRFRRGVFEAKVLKKNKK